MLEFPTTRLVTTAFVVVELFDTRFVTVVVPAVNVPAKEALPVVVRLPRVSLVTDVFSIHVAPSQYKEDPVADPPIIVPAILTH